MKKVPLAINPHTDRFYLPYRERLLMAYLVAHALGKLRP
jgi:hypothetical protein